MQKLSVLNSFTLFRRTLPEACMAVQVHFRKRDELPHEYVAHDLPHVENAFRRLKPLVRSLPNKYLFCKGIDGSHAVFSNYVTGSAAALAPTVSVRHTSDWLAVNHEYPALARAVETGSTKSHKPQRGYLNFYLDAIMAAKSIRTIRCVDSGEGDIDYSNWGELLPFENSSDYECLSSGQAPSFEVMTKFCNYFGWPHPTTREFLDFIVSCQMFVFPSLPEEQRVGQNLELEMLRPPDAWGQKTLSVRAWTSRFMGSERKGDRKVEGFEEALARDNRRPSRWERQWDEFEPMIRGAIEEKIGTPHSILIVPGHDGIRRETEQNKKFLVFANSDDAARLEEYRGTYLNIARGPKGFPKIDANVVGVDRNRIVYVTVEQKAESSEHRPYHIRFEPDCSIPTDVYLDHDFRRGDRTPYDARLDWPP